MIYAKYLKKARSITQEYIETYGASFNDIDALDCMIAEALQESNAKPTAHSVYAFPATSGTYMVNAEIINKGA